MKIAFLDRDGVINNDTGYLYRIEDFVFTDGCVDALRYLQAQGFQLIVVTNQSGIGRGYYSEADYHALTQWYRDQLQQRGVNILDVFHCPHGPGQNCDCRKPKPGLFQQALKKYPHIRLEQSLMIGDKLSDLEAADAMGLEQFILFDRNRQLTEALSSKPFAKYAHTIHQWSGLFDLLS